MFMEEDGLRGTKMYQYLSAYENSTGGPFAFYSIPKAIRYEQSDGTTVWPNLIIDFSSVDKTALATVSFSYIDRYSQKIDLFSAVCHNKYLCDGLAEAKEWIVSNIETGKITRLYQNTLPGSGYDVKPGDIKRKHIGFATQD